MLEDATFDEKGFVNRTRDALDVVSSRLGISGPRAEALDLAIKHDRLI